MRLSGLLNVVSRYDDCLVLFIGKTKQVLPDTKNKENNLKNLGLNQTQLKTSKKVFMFYRTKYILKYFSSCNLNMMSIDGISLVFFLFFFL